MVNMKKELISLVKASGLNDKKQEAVQLMVKAFVEEAEKRENELKTLIVKDVNDTQTMKIARDSRLELKDQRLKLDKLIKQKREEVQKEMLSFTLEDKMWLKTSQLFEMTFKKMEHTLLQQENYIQIQEQKRLDELKEKRTLELRELEICPPVGIETHDEEIYEVIKSGLIQKKKEDDLLKEEQQKIQEQARQQVQQKIQVEKRPDLTETEVLQMWVKTFDIKEPIKFSDSEVSTEIKLKFDSFVKWAHKLIIEKAN
jgi:hypothetical protein